MLSQLRIEGSVDARVKQGRISFEADGHSWEILSGVPICNANQIWVLHQPDYKVKPLGPNGTYQVYASNPKLMQTASGEWALSDHQPNLDMFYGNQDFGGIDFKTYRSMRPREARRRRSILYLTKSKRFRRHCALDELLWRGRGVRLRRGQQLSFFQRRRLSSRTGFTYWINNKLFTQDTGKVRPLS